MQRNIVDILRTVETVEITTTGRNSGSRRRLEIWMYEIDGRYIITGTPGPRDWFANVLADPRMILHLPGGYDLETTATEITDQEFRNRVFTADKTAWYRSQTSVKELVDNSPMVELTFIESHARTTDTQ